MNLLHKAPVLTQSMRWERRPLAGWAIGVAALAAVTIGSWPSFAEQADQFEAAMANMPAIFTAMMGEAGATFTASSVVGARLFGTMALILFPGYIISRAARALAAEEEAGTLELVATSPLPRWRVAVERLVAAWWGLESLLLLQFAILEVANRPLDLGFTHVAMIESSFGMFAVASLFGGLSFLVATASGRRGWGVAAAGVAAAAAFVVTGLGAQIEAFEGVAAISPFTYFDGSVVLERGVSWLTIGVNTGIGLAMTVLGVVAFTKRDIA